MSIQASSFNPLLSQQAALGPSISDFNSGNIFGGQGNDFLSPKNVLNNVDGFSKSVSFGGSYLGSNPNARYVLGQTTDSLQAIMTNSFGVDLTAPIAPNPYAAYSTGGGIPVTGGTTQVVQTPSPALIRDLSNFNPLIWQNPNANNIMLGNMDAQNKIMGGNGIFQPPVFNRYPLYPFIAPPSAPYNNFAVQIPNQGGVTNLPQAQQFPTTFVTGSNFYNTYAYTQPYAMPMGQTLTPYQSQLLLARLIQARSGAVSNQLMGSLAPTNQGIASSNVPPWASLQGTAQFY